jgi:hypothetical protein
VKPIGQRARKWSCAVAPANISVDSPYCARDQPRFAGQ